MEQPIHNKIVSFIWGIADDVLRDLFKRGKYPDVILPVCVLRRMDAVLEPSKKSALETKEMLDNARLVETANALHQDLGGEVFEDHRIFRDRVDGALKKLAIKLSAPDLKHILRAVSWRVETAPPVIAKVHKPGKATVDPLHGRYLSPGGDKKLVFEYEADSDLKDTEQVPQLELGRHRGLHPPRGATLHTRRVDQPRTPKVTKIGYEISFTRHFHQPQPLRTLDEIRADILAVEKEAEGLLDKLLNGQP